MNDPTRFVLVGTSHAGNVGAAARAMKVMGYGDLVLVQPRYPDVLTHADALAFAAGEQGIDGPHPDRNRLGDAVAMHRVGRMASPSATGEGLDALYRLVPRCKGGSRRASTPGHGAAKPRKRLLLLSQ